MSKEYILDSVRNDGFFTGVFEFDEDTGYFYLFSNKDQRIVDQIYVFSNTADIAQENIFIKWSTDGKRVGLFIKNTLWAIFNLDNQSKFGGNYTEDEVPNIPNEELI